MTANDDITKQHDIDELEEKKPKETLDDQDENQVDGEEMEDLDKIHERAFGDEDSENTITEEVNEDETAIAKDLTKRQQE